MTEKTLAEQMADESEQLRRRHVHATRPRGPLTMDQAAGLAALMTGGELRDAAYVTFSDDGGPPHRLFR